MEYPKCYWIWNYRLWTLNQAIQRLPVSAARRVWEEELGLVGKMLQRDRRNFHAWGYRRHVVIQLESPELAGKTMAESEFDYTTKAVRQDLSNFSAWHNRCQLIPRVLSERSADDAHRKEFLEAGMEHSHELSHMMANTCLRACTHPEWPKCRPGRSVTVVLSSISCIQHS